VVSNQRKNVSLAKNAKCAKETFERFLGGLGVPGEINRFM
jgi:hypothetical protein